MVEKRQKETMLQRVVENVKLKLLLQKIAVGRNQAPQGLVNNHPKKSEFRAFFIFSNLAENQSQKIGFRLFSDE